MEANLVAGAEQVAGSRKQEIGMRLAFLRRLKAEPPAEEGLLSAQELEGE
jgi:hypothetical protein